MSREDRPKDPDSVESYVALATGETLGAIAAGRWSETMLFDLEQASASCPFEGLEEAKQRAQKLAQAYEDEALATSYDLGLNEINHLLACLAEESAEIIQDTAKAQRFGLEDRHAKGGEKNLRERILSELNDLLGVADLLVDEGIFPAGWQDLEAQAQKKAKVRDYMVYAINTGALKLS